MEHHTLKTLAESIMREPFAKMHRLAEKNLEEVGAVLASLQEKYDVVSANPGVDPELAEVIPSFEKTKEFYCLILLKIEEERLVSEDFDSLSSLAESGSKTVLSHPPDRKTDEPPPLRAVPDWGNELPDFEERASSNEQSNFFPDELPPLEAEIALEDFPEHQVEQLLVQPPELPMLFLAEAPRASDYLRFAQWLDGAKQDKKFEGEFLDRLICQNLCFALESENLYLLGSAIDNFWAQRQEAVRGILNQSGPRFELHAELAKTVGNLATKHSDWLYEGHFSNGSVLNALRYMVSSKLNSFEPSLLETGVLLMLFGTDQLDGCVLKNFLGIQTTTEEEIVETSFRLMRIPKLKNRSLHVTSEFNNDNRTQLESDIRRVTELVNKFADGKSRGLKVA